MADIVEWREDSAGGTESGGVEGWHEACELRNPTPEKAGLSLAPNPEQSRYMALHVLRRQDQLGHLLSSLAPDVTGFSHYC